MKPCICRLELCGNGKAISSVAETLRLGWTSSLKQATSWSIQKRRKRKRRRRNAQPTRVQEEQRLQVAHQKGLVPVVIKWTKSWCSLALTSPSLWSLRSNCSQDWHCIVVPRRHSICSILQTRPPNRRIFVWAFSVQAPTRLSKTIKKDQPTRFPWNSRTIQHWWFWMDRWALWETCCKLRGKRSLMLKFATTTWLAPQSPWISSIWRAHIMWFLCPSLVRMVEHWGSTIALLSCHVMPIHLAFASCGTSDGAKRAYLQSSRPCALLGAWIWKQGGHWSFTRRIRFTATAWLFYRFVWQTPNLIKPIQKRNVLIFGTDLKFSFRKKIGLNWGPQVVSCEICRLMVACIAGCEFLISESCCCCSVFLFQWHLTCCFFVLTGSGRWTVSHETHTAFGFSISNPWFSVTLGGTYKDPLRMAHFGWERNTKF